MAAPRQMNRHAQSIQRRQHHRQYNEHAKGAARSASTRRRRKRGCAQNLLGGTSPVFAGTIGTSSTAASTSTPTTKKKCGQNPLIGGGSSAVRPPPWGSGTSVKHPPTEGTGVSGSKPPGTSPTLPLSTAGQPTSSQSSSKSTPTPTRGDPNSFSCTDPDFMAGDETQSHLKLWTKYEVDKALNPIWEKWKTVPHTKSTKRDGKGWTLSAFISDSLGAGDGMNCGHIDPDNLNDDGNCQSIGSIDKCTLSLTKRGQTSNVLHPASVYALSAMTGVRGLFTTGIGKIKRFFTDAIGWAAPDGSGNNAIMDRFTHFMKEDPVAQIFQQLFFTLIGDVIGFGVGSFFTGAVFKGVLSAGMKSMTKFTPKGPPPYTPKPLPGHTTTPPKNAPEWGPPAAKPKDVPEGTETPTAYSKLASPDLLIKLTSGSLVATILREMPNKPMGDVTGKIGATLAFNSMMNQMSNIGVDGMVQNAKDLFAGDDASVNKITAMLGPDMLNFTPNPDEVMADVGITQMAVTIRTLWAANGFTHPFVLLVPFPCNQNGGDPWKDLWAMWPSQNDLPTGDVWQEYSGQCSYLINLDPSKANVVCTQNSKESSTCKVPNKGALFNKAQGGDKTTLPNATGRRKRDPPNLYNFWGLQFGMIIDSVLRDWMANGYTNTPKKKRDTASGLFLGPDNPIAPGTFKDIPVVNCETMDDCRLIRHAWVYLAYHKDLIKEKPWWPALTKEDFPKGWNFDEWPPQLNMGKHSKRGDPHDDVANVQWVDPEDYEHLDKESHEWAS